MAGSPQYLQVPKALPHRKARSRSRSRTREAPEAVTIPRTRPSTPPLVPTTDAMRKSQANGYLTNGHTTTNGCTNRNSLCGEALAHAKREADIGSAMVTLTAPDMSREETSYDDLNGGIYTLETCSTPPPQLLPPEPSLRERLAGAWRLESYTAYPTPTSKIQRPTFPMTKNVTGFIMYTTDGYMSAQMLIPGQQSFKRGEGEEPQWAEAGKRFFAYCGPYYISNEGPNREEVLRHTFQVCNLPGWIGDVQVRTQHFEEDGQVLVLGSEEPTEIKGDKRIPVLKWRRARDNTNGEPPPPTPSIKISGPGEL